MNLSKIKAVFIDRDGTINEEKEYVNRIEDFELIPGSLEALRLLTEHQMKVYIITNQAGIAKGFFSEEQFHQLTKDMMDLFRNERVRIEEVLYCPHHPDGIVPEYSKDCLCRKPNTGLIEQVIKKNNFETDEIVLIGDKNSDIEAGRRLGIRTYLVETGYGGEEKHRTNATFVMKNLKDAVVHLLDLGKKEESRRQIPKGKV